MFMIDLYQTQKLDASCRQWFSLKFERLTDCRLYSSLSTGYQDELFSTMENPANIPTPCNTPHDKPWHYSPN